MTRRIGPVLRFANWRLLGVPTLAALALAGCASRHPMMPAPVLYTGPQAEPLFTGAPAAARTPPLDLLYVTDRAPGKPGQDPGPYVSGRSRSLAFGTTTVHFGENVAWESLVQRSVQVDRSPEIVMALGATTELGRFPPIPYAVVMRDGGIGRAPAALAAHAAASRGLQAEIARRLAMSARKELVLYVHGYNNTFEDAALTMGELCHFLGREFACGIFTWPAGSKKGVLFGYEADYESSVYASDHLRKAIRTIAATPGLERLHFLAHSRGTDVLATALSELAIEAYMQRTSVARYLKLGNLVLMAPDIDADVAPTKIFKLLSDPDLPYGGAPDPEASVEEPPGSHLTLYTSPHDKALATSSWLFGGVARLGLLQPSMLRPDQQEAIRRLGFFDVIEFTGSTDFVGHGYFVSSPKVSADIIAMLRYGLRPNEPGRPLEEVERPFWRIH
jgi:esterase/lipase superfamily enzyme